MTTATMNVTAEKTAACKVTWNEIAVTITSPTGTAIQVNSGKLSFESRTLYDLLTFHPQRVSKKITLTFSQLSFLKGLSAPASRITEERTIEQTRVGVEARVSAPTNHRMTTEETKINQLEAVSQAVNQPMWMLIYDIPVLKNDACPNPSYMLWHFGFRLNASCWVLPQKGLDAKRVQGMLSHFQTHSIECHLIPYADHALEQIRGIAREKLRQEVIRVHESLVKRIISAKERLDAATAELETPNWKDVELLEKKRDSEVRAILKNCSEALNASISCAEIFEETESTKELLSGLRGAIRAEQMAFNAQMKAKNGKVIPVLPA